GFGFLDFLFPPFLTFAVCCSAPGLFLVLLSGFLFSCFWFPGCFFGLFRVFRFFLLRSKRSKEFSSMTSTDSFLSSTRFLDKSSNAVFFSPFLLLEINCFACSKVNLYQLKPPSV